MSQSSSNAVVTQVAPVVSSDKGQRTALRILQVVTRLGVGGAEHGMLNVMAGLAHDNVEQQICTMRGVEPGLMWQDRVNAEVLVAAENGARFRLDVARLAQIFRQVRPHIVHSRNWGCLEAVVAARIAGVPVAVHSEHGYELDMLEGLPMRRRLFRAAAFRMAQAIFAVTKDLRDYHAKQAFVSPDRIGVIYNGVNVEKFRPMMDARQSLRAQFAISESTCVFGTVGRLVPIKDQKSLLQAVGEMSGRGMDVMCMIVGSGPLMEELREFADSMPSLAGRVVLTGARSDTPQLLNAMDVFVLPSISEGMSNTLLEALASGLPLVATGVGGNPEVLGDGECGVTFAPRDVRALTGILSDFAEDPQMRARLGANSRKRAVNTFSLGKMISQYHDMYWGLAERHGVLKQTEVTHVRN